MSLHNDMRLMGDRALEASRGLANLSARRKNAALLAMADALDEGRAALIAANAADVADARAARLSEALIDRLTLTESRLEAMAHGVRGIAALRDPGGRCLQRRVRPNGLVIVKRRVPIGVIVIVYEARPNVTADAAALCLKAGNAVILRGGKEARRSNLAIAALMAAAGAAARLPVNAMQIVATTDRDAVRELARMDDRVDLIIPRGGESLIRSVVEVARVPVIKHYKGVCHVFVDHAADLGMALNIVENAKCQRPGVCNALETLLVHADVAPVFLPRLAERCARRRVEVRADAAARAVVPSFGTATEDDWAAEYLDLILAVRVVPDLDAAIVHISRYGSRHSDAIVTGDTAAAGRFTREVDSAAVYVNASTRFTDGGEFGMGAEIGISTDKLHARGPMGLNELTSYKYVIQGSGQIRS